MRKLLKLIWKYLPVIMLIAGTIGVVLIIIFN